MPHLALPAAAVSVVLLLAGCSGDTSSGTSTDGPSSATTSESAATPSESATFNAADVAFAQGMIPHHGQALAMARMAPGRTESPEVADLARRIEAAQEPEIAEMTSWLQAWGQEVPDAAAGGATEGHAAHGMDAEEHEAGGMLTAEEMADLEQATGEDWDRLFLIGMIAHHEGAVAMAEQQLAEGSYPPALELAEAIIEGQQAEIEEMRALLG
ncbi:DUF305 domain-containing protein [Kineosporiaceae bacterium SCSIO 59966]|nr:DUF305 domain-containing protein [Kineosporiaceae bacterium SCSIO 59966]